MYYYNDQVCIFAFNYYYNDDQSKSSKTIKQIIKKKERKVSTVNIKLCLCCCHATYAWMFVNPNTQGGDEPRGRSERMCTVQVQGGIFGQILKVYQKLMWLNHGFSFLKKQLSWNRFPTSFLSFFCTLSVWKYVEKHICL